MNDILKGKKKLHFIGIGGSGMCPMAEILHHAGYEITGSDKNTSDTLDRIKSYGIKVFMEHSPENINGTDVVVHTAAVKQDNPEIVAAKAQGIPVYERSVVLGYLTEHFKKAIAVSGTHGKTSTTAMITQILIQANFDPSAIIGGKLPLIGGNGRVGKSDYMVCEACEYVDTFLQLHPFVSVILNLEADHLDYFKNLDNIIKSFHQFSKQTSGAVIVNGDDAEAMQAVENIQNAEIITFGRNSNCDYSIKDEKDVGKACKSYTMTYKGDEVCTITLKVPGEHNVMNSLAAGATAHHFGVDGSFISQALGAFTGVHRRFEILGEFSGITIADDFAHHPTELTVILDATSQMGYNNVWAIFQPHTYSRTFLLLDDFAKALSIPEHVVMTEILAVREVNTYGVDIMDLENKIPGSCHFKTFDEISDYVIKNAKSGDLIMTIGGGDIYKCANMIVDKYKNM